MQLDEEGERERMREKKDRQTERLMSHLDRKCINYWKNFPQKINHSSF